MRRRRWRRFRSPLNYPHLVASGVSRIIINDDVGEGLGHGRDALTGLERCVGAVDLGLRSSDSLQPRLSHWGLSAPTTRACGAPGARSRPRLRSERNTDRPTAEVPRAESPSYDSLG